LTIRSAQYRSIRPPSTPRNSDNRRQDPPAPGLRLFGQQEIDEQPQGDWDRDDEDQHNPDDQHPAVERCQGRPLDPSTHAAVRNQSSGAASVIGTNPYHGDG